METIEKPGQSERDESNDLYESQGVHTYRMSEVSKSFDFEIRDQNAKEAITKPHRHDFFQIHANFALPNPLHAPSNPNRVFCDQLRCRIPAAGALHATT
jgi:hypothetical protein